MIISLINLSNGELQDREIQVVIRAINRQIAEDFMPYWSIGAILRLEGHGDTVAHKQNLADMRGDAVIYLWNKSDVADAIGYHERNNAGIPYGFVFLDIAKELGEDWSVTLSHEALELIADPEVNLLVAGPHPDPAKEYDVFFWYEMSDPVQNDSYLIDGVSVSNFILPLYFTSGDEFDGRNDFLGSSLKSFNINPGGYVGFFDPQIKGHTTYSRQGDAVAQKRIQIKGKLEKTRRAIRYQGRGGKRKSSAQEGAASN